MPHLADLRLRPFCLAVEQAIAECKLGVSQRAATLNELEESVAISARTLFVRFIDSVASPSTPFPYEDSVCQQVILALTNASDVLTAPVLRESVAAKIGIINRSIEVGCEQALEEALKEEGFSSGK